MKYCSQCGGPLIRRVPEGDHLERSVCEACETIHYENPKIVSGCIATWEDRILLCRRAIEPRYGLWTLPAGYMENDETTADAAARETEEEAGAQVEIVDLFAMINLPHINQVYVMYRGNMRSGEYEPGIESLEADLFEQDSIPWHDLAFPVVNETLRRFFLDRERGKFRIHVGDIVPVDRARNQWDVRFLQD
jgi:ADP-ribose pyrophosphatase YjhB (NUDIX family)